MPVRRPVALLLLCAALAALAAGCGAGSPPVYTAKGTVKCLGDKGFKNITTDPLKVGLIAGTAENGGIQAKAPNGNVVTIAFAADEAGAASTEQAFRTHATPFYKRHISDIMESQRNAVLVWTTSPTQLQLSNALGCLAS
jgi:hypothetical protein